MSADELETSEGSCQNSGINPLQSIFCCIPHPDSLPFENSGAVPEAGWAPQISLVLQFSKAQLRRGADKSTPGLSPPLRALVALADLQGGKSTPGPSTHLRGLVLLADLPIEVVGSVVQEFTLRPRNRSTTSYSHRPCPDGPSHCLQDRLSPRAAATCGGARSLLRLAVSQGIPLVGDILTAALSRPVGATSAMDSIAT